MSYLIDTDTIVYSLNNNPVVIEQFRQRRDAPKSLSVITYGELVFGARKSTFVEKNLGKVRRIAELFPIIQVTKAIMETFGEMKALLEERGQRHDDMDLLIACTAITHNLILVTNNIKHFDRIEGLEIENWTV